MAKKIYLSPSNQGLNIYATGNTNEMHQCDKIAAAADKALERCGFEVMVGKSGDTMANRCRESDAFGADLHMPIHTNAFNEKVTGGTLVMLYKNSTANNKAGQAILNAVAKISPGPDYALQYRPELVELNTPKAISVYLEVEFHDTKIGADWIRNNITAIGEAIAKGVCNYYGVKYKAPTTSTPAKDKTEEAKPSSSTLYRVQAGAYKKKDRASAQLKKVKAAGFTDAFIVKSGDYYKVQMGAFRSRENAEAQLEKVKAKGFSAFVTTKSGEAVSSSASTTSKPKTIKEGSKVRLKDGARTYTGGWLAPFVYNRVHKVSELNGKRAVITYDGTVVAAVHVSDLILV